MTRRARAASPLGAAAVVVLATTAALLVLVTEHHRPRASGGAPPVPASGGAPPVPAPGGRDPWLRPFSSHSIWNTPIGSGARYVPAHLPEAANGVGLDENLLVRTSASDPQVPVLQPGDWQHRCAGTASTPYSLRLPPGWLVPDAFRNSEGFWVTPNNVGAFLEPDGRTLVNINAVARCRPGGPVFGYVTQDPSWIVTDLYGDGIVGSHGGSQLSGLGGAIRKGELTGDAPVRHALDLLISGDHLSMRDGGCRWPALHADGHASPQTYRGTVPDLRMGALLAIPPSVTPASLHVRTEVGQKVFAALRDYGGYVTDNAGWDFHYLAADSAAVGTFPWGAAERAEVNRIFTALAVVANNGPSSIGGGGTPRAPLLPELVAP